MSKMRRLNGRNHRPWLFLSAGLFVFLGVAIFSTFLHYGLTEATRGTDVKNPLPGRRAAVYWIIVVTVAVILWIPRLSGPIDLRWDGSVYYVLGTSLSTGAGYRIISEPGCPEELQYPPLLPAIIAAYQRGFHSTDPAIVGPPLRISYAALFVTYGVLVFALATRYLVAPLALVATLVCLL